MILSGCMLGSIGAAHGADVSISPGNGFKHRVGVDFNLSCKFTFLSSMHFAQMWKEGESKVGQKYFSNFTEMLQ